MKMHVSNNKSHDLIPSDLSVYSPTELLPFRTVTAMAPPTGDHIP